MIGRLQFQRHSIQIGRASQGSFKSRSPSVLPTDQENRGFPGNPRPRQEGCFAHHHEAVVLSSSRAAIPATGRENVGAGPRACPWGGHLAASPGGKKACPLTEEHLPAGADERNTPPAWAKTKVIKNRGGGEFQIDKKGGRGSSLALETVSQ
jgi:hypothetical protein